MSFPYLFSTPLDGSTVLCCREIIRRLAANQLHRGLTSAGFSASSVEKYHYTCCFHRRIGSNPIFTADISRSRPIWQETINQNVTLSFIGNISWRISDVAGACGTGNRKVPDECIFGFQGTTQSRATSIAIKLYR